MPPPGKNNKQETLGSTVPEPAETSAGHPRPAQAPRPEEADHQLALILSGMSDGLMALDREWRCLCVNRAAAGLFQKSPAELLGRCVWDAFPEAVGQPVWEHLHRSMAQHAPDEFEARCVHLDVWYRARCLPTKQGVVIFFTDITEQKRTREAQHVRERSESERLARAHAAVCRSERMLLDRNRRLDLLHQAAGQLLAGSPDELLPRLYERLVAFFEVDAYFECHVATSGQALELVACRGVSPDALAALARQPFGQTICGRVAQQRQPIIISHIQESSDPMLHGLKPLGLRAYAGHPLIVGSRLLGTLAFASRQRESFSAEDIDFFQTLANYVAAARERTDLMRDLQEHSAQLEKTVKERTASLQEIIAELQHMSYSMVHDMRGPLRALTGFAQLWLREEGEQVNPRTKNYLERIIAAARSMDQLVVDALNYNKILRESPVLQPVEPGQLLHDLVSTHENFQPPRAQVRLKGPFPPVLGNPGLLSRCFSHLLDNAVKFVPADRPPEVEVWAETVAPPAPQAGAPPSREKVRLCIADNGIGIEPAHQERIFGLFQRMHGPESQGTGAGLALVRKMVERMGGRIWVESTLGHGSRFWLELPAPPP